ncbi:MAG TPA: MaoC/PaaZ C-terminal domain-containing protein [Bacillota bacterium]|nr:MaoC/PaaZ C-terminal domain-containing protein [Bacillota bacterium]
MIWEQLNEGAELSPWLTPPITADWLYDYAKISGDFNPIHLDPQAANDAGFEGVIVHGMLNMAMMMKVVTPWLDARTMVKKFQTRFHSPLKVGESLHVSGRVVNKALEDHTITIRLEGRNQQGDLIVVGMVILEVT